MRSHGRRASWVLSFAVTIAGGMLVGPLVPAGATIGEAKQRRRSPALHDHADQEQHGEVVDGAEGTESASWTRSVEARRNGAMVRTAPDAQRSEPRGLLAPGARFAVLDRRAGGGCSGDWLRVADDAWVCADHVTLVRAEPAVGPYPVLDDDAIVPFEYAFSGRAGTRAFARPSDIDAGTSAATLGTSWGLAIVGTDMWRGQPVARTTRGTWIVARELRWVEPSRFAGVTLARGQPATTLSVAWVRRGGAPTFADPDGRRRTGRLRGRALVPVGTEATAGGEPMTRLSEGGFVPSSLLVRPTRIAPPEGVARGERWIDVDLERQTLVAYEGAEPVFATLVSTGRRPGTTPVGLHRVWIKIAHATMDNVEDDDARQTYSMDGVPWIQYFAGDVALHAAYWHDGFGAVRSHGCVNLAPRDARWLYAFTSPRVPDGWARMFPPPGERGTPVHVR
ncbi:MAG: L,D-transpeptidase [Deltaproteobacteria bacterium]|nr:L,D-transpeptidase [Deltaproteobacteria bacterium]